MSRRLLSPADLSALSRCAPDLAQAFVSLSSDIALVIDAHGVVTSVAQDPKSPMAPDAESWIGKPWIETVTDETRLKIERLLGDVSSTGLARRRQVNHADGDGTDIPVAYTALRLGEDGPVLAVGRDLRTVAAIQQRFLASQQELERGYWRTRQTEVRHRLLLQVATDAVMTVDAQTLCIVEANPAAAVLLRSERWPLAGRVAEQQFEANSRPALREVFAQAQASNRPAEIQARLAGSHLTVGVLVLPLRTSAGLRLLLRARAAEPVASDSLPLEAALARLVESTRDGVVVTNARGEVTGGNPAFVHMVQGQDEDQLRGRPLADWLGRLDSDMPALIYRVREEGIAQGVQLGLRRADRGPLDVEVWSTLLMEGEQEGLGFIVRPRLQARDPAPLAPPADLARAIDALATELGHHPLADLARRAERLARLHLVRRALNQTASDEEAASLLGVTSAQLAQLQQELVLEAATPTR